MTDTTEKRWERHNEDGRRAFAKGELARAEEAFVAAIREAMELGTDNLRLASSLSNLGQLKYKQQDFAQADALFRRSLAIREHVLGPEHQGVVQSIGNLATLQYTRGELGEAQTLFERALALSEKNLGPEHADLAPTLNNLARLHFKNNDLTSAGPLLDRLLVIKEQTHGAESMEVAAILASLARVRSAAGNHAAADELARRTLEIREQQCPPNDPAVIAALDLLAYCAAMQGRREEEQSLRARSRELRGGSARRDEPRTAEISRAWLDAPTAELRRSPSPITVPAVAEVAPVRETPVRNPLPAAAVAPSTPEASVATISPDAGAPVFRTPVASPIDSPVIDRAAAFARDTAPSLSALSSTAEAPASLRNPFLRMTPRSTTPVEEQPAVELAAASDPARSEEGGTGEWVVDNGRGKWKVAAVLLVLALLGGGALFAARQFGLLGHNTPAETEVRDQGSVSPSRAPTVVAQGPAVAPPSGRTLPVVSQPVKPSIAATPATPVAPAQSPATPPLAVAATPHPSPANGHGGSSATSTQQSAASTTSHQLSGTGAAASPAPKEPTHVEKSAPAAHPARAADPAPAEAADAARRDAVQPPDMPAVSLDRVTKSIDNERAKLDSVAHTINAKEPVFEKAKP
jgi:tetratricopeptide (TPR) repeat protein